MGFFWFLVFCAQLARAFSLLQFEDNELRYKQVDVQLSLYHVHTIVSSQTSTSELSFSDMFVKDEERVRAIHSRLTNTVETSSGHRSSSTSGRPKPVSIPVKSGLSIGSGNYLVKIGLGTPAKYFSMLIDTGSSLSWLQCQPCNSYCHAQVDPIFNSSTSKTHKTLPCSSPQCSSLKAATLNDPSCETETGSCLYRATYGDSSFSIGYLSQDVLSLTPSQRLADFVYGCGQNNEGLFGMTAGILGLAHDKLSMLAQLSTKYGYAFSYCLPTSFSAVNSSRKGFLSIGSSSMAKSSFKFTPMVKNPKIPSLYLLDLTMIKVGGKPLKVAASSYKVPTIIDSGTVITRLPMSVYEELRKEFVKIMARKYEQAPGVSLLDTCFKGSVRSMLAVPGIQMIFHGGADLTLNAHNTLLEIQKGITCLTIAGNDGPNAVSIIGNYQQQTFGVAYDVSNSRIGFSPGGCQ